MTQEQRHRHFAQLLRIVLFDFQKLQYNMAALKEYVQGAPHIKNGINNINNSINRLVGDCRARTGPDNWALVYQDLSSDKVHDLNLLDEEMMDITDISGILDAIRKVKAECLAEQTQAA